jgi:sugar O-acyltransferase (sialic acid O-acetyltransferase NeuD family)
MDVADLISDIPGWHVDGFAVSLAPHEPGATLLGRPIYWVDELSRFTASHRAVCAIVTTKRTPFIRRAEELGMRFAAVIHPTARVSRQASIGDGTIISAGVLVSAHSEIGRHVILNRGAIIGHHVKIHDHATIGPGANLAGAVTVGQRAWIGMSAVVLEQRSIGELAIVGAGSVVTRDVPARTKVMGAPARALETDGEGY